MAEQIEADPGEGTPEAEVELTEEQTVAHLDGRLEDE